MNRRNFFKSVFVGAGIATASTSTFSKSLLVDNPFAWQDFVGWQPMQGGSDTGSVFTLELIKEEAFPRFSITVKSHAVEYEKDCVYTDANIVDGIEHAMQNFPVRLDDTDLPPINKFIRMLNKVAQQTRRGRINTQFGNAWYYSGTNISDRPIQVFGHSGRYGIFTMDNFENYGFRAPHLPVGYEADDAGNRIINAYHKMNS